jgi:peptidoglycan hydrolase-like protein with peptidoglycan-binding domain
MRAIFHVGLTLLLSASPAWSATIKVRPPERDVPALILVEGELQYGDEKRFVEHALKLDEAIVLLGSRGGNLYAGLEIGRAIRLKGFATFVPDDVHCASACAAAWLAGRPRAMGSNARVGFHAGYRVEAGQAKEDAVGNAMLGAYLNSLGLPEDFVIYATRTPPEGMQWLSFEDAKRLGVDVRRVGDEKAAADPIGPSQRQPPKVEATVGSPSEDNGRAPPALGSEPPVIVVSAPTVPDLSRLEDAVRVQLRLKELRYLQTATVDGTWGPRSRVALRDFKVSKGLPANDAWDEQAVAALFDAGAPPAPQWYRPPDPETAPVGLYSPYPATGGAVLTPLNPAEAIIIQRRLGELGYYSLTPQGAWGEASRVALRNFKAAHGLTPDDVWDTETERAISAAGLVGAGGTPFGEWALAGHACTQTRGFGNLSVAGHEIRVGEVVCHVQQKWTRRGGAWTSDAVCQLSGRGVPSRIALAVSGNTLTDRSVVGVPAGSATFTRCIP